MGGTNCILGAAIAMVYAVLLARTPTSAIGCAPAFSAVEPDRWARSHTIEKHVPRHSHQPGSTAWSGITSLRLTRMLIRRLTAPRVAHMAGTVQSVGLT